MKLIDLIGYLLKPEMFNGLIRNYNIRIEDFNDLQVYFCDLLDLHSELAFFTEEESNDDLIFERDGVRYVHLFTIWEGIELVEEYLKVKENGYTNLQTAERLLHYRRYDV